MPKPYIYDAEGKYLIVIQERGNDLFYSSIYRANFLLIAEYTHQFLLHNKCYWLFSKNTLKRLSRKDQRAMKYIFPQLDLNDILAYDKTLKVKIESMFTR